MKQIKYVKKSYAKKIFSMTRITKNQFMNIQSRSGKSTKNQLMSIQSRSNTSTSAKYFIFRQSTAFVKYLTLRHSTVTSTKSIVTQSIVSSANQKYESSYNNFNVHQKNEQSMQKKNEQSMRKEYEHNRNENNSSNSENNQDANNASLNSNENSIESSNENSNENQSDITVLSASTIVSSYSVIQINVVDTFDFELCFIMNNVFVKNDNVFVNSFNQYVASRQKEITRLLKKEIFEIVNQQDISSNNRIFNFRFVDEIKHSDTNIQNAKLYFRDIAQAYVQFSSKLNHFYTRLSEELIKMFDVDHNFILKQHTKKERSSNIRLFEKLIKMLDVDHNFILKQHTKKKIIEHSSL